MSNYLPKKFHLADDNLNAVAYYRADIAERLAEALRGMFCPRPCNGRPHDFDVGDCYDAGECGCIAGSALSAWKDADASQLAVNEALNRGDARALACESAHQEKQP